MIEVSLTDLAPGCIVEIAGLRCTVDATFDLTSDGWTWQDHRLIGHSWWHWLTVEVDRGEVSCAGWTERCDLAPLAMDAGGRTMTVDGLKYKRSERGTGTYRQRGTDDSGPYEYLDYATGRDRLSFERFGTDPFEAAVGGDIPIGTVRAWRPA